MHWNRRSPLALVRSARQLQNLVSELEPDVLHLHSFFAGLVGRLVRPGLAVVVYQPHGWGFSSRSRARNAAVVALERCLVRSTDALAALSSREQESALERGLRFSYVTVLGSAVSAPFHARRQSIGGDRIRRVLVVGRICEAKGQRELAQAISRFPGDLSSIDLVFVGKVTAAERDGLAKVLTHASRSPRVNFVGELDPDELAEMFATSWLTLIPSRWEGLSLTMLESIVCGCPVVSTDVSGAREYICAQPPTGAVVRRGDLSALLEEVERRIQRTEIVAAETANARRRDVDPLTAAALSVRVDSLYRDLGCHL
jgi:glycosyltransferase involved in cell wall biosynthesis